MLSRQAGRVSARTVCPAAHVEAQLCKTRGVLEAVLPVEKGHVVPESSSAFSAGDAQRNQPSAAAKAARRSTPSGRPFSVPFRTIGV